MDDTEEAERDSRRGQETPLKVDPKLVHDVQLLVSRLAAKAPQLLGNHTTNLAEAWMHIRCKFDGGKVVNRSQSGSWQHRCMGAALSQNLGATWSPQVWSSMTNEMPNHLFAEVAESTQSELSKQRKRKATEEAKAR